MNFDFGPKRSWVPKPYKFTRFGGGCPLAGSPVDRARSCRRSAGKTPKSILQLAFGRPEGRFRCLRGSSPAKLRPGRPIYGPEALVRNIKSTYTTTLRVRRRLGEGSEDPKRVRITKRKKTQKTLRQIVLKSSRPMESSVFVVAICVKQFGILNAWACVCMCIYVRMVILSSRYCFPHAPR